MVSKRKKQAASELPGATVGSHAATRPLPDLGTVPPRAPGFEGNRTRMSSREIEESLVASTGIDQLTAESAWRAVLDLFHACLVGGRDLSFVNIGTLHPYKKAKSRYRDPVTGKLIAVPGRQHVNFTLAKELKADLRDARLAASGRAEWEVVFAAKERAAAAAKKEQQERKKVEALALKASLQSEAVQIPSVIAFKPLKRKAAAKTK